MKEDGDEREIDSTTVRARTRQAWVCQGDVSKMQLSVLIAPVREDKIKSRVIALGEGTSVSGSRECRQTGQRH